MVKNRLAWMFWAVVMSIPPSVLAQEATALKAYDDCITRYVVRSPSHQAAIILQRACYYKFRYYPGDGAGVRPGAEYRKLAKIYKPAVCDCVFERMPVAPPNVPPPQILDACVRASQKPATPLGP